MSESHFLKFRVGGEEFGLPVAHVDETVRLVAPTPVPTHVVGLLGVANVRGRVVPIFDLATVLGEEPRPLSLRMYIVIAEVGDELVGLVVDDVLDVVTTSSDRYQQTAALGGETSLTAGVARVGDHMLTILGLHTLIEAANAVRAELPAELA